MAMGYLWSNARHQDEVTSTHCRGKLFLALHLRAQIRTWANGIRLRWADQNGQSRKNAHPEFPVSGRQCDSSPPWEPSLFQRRSCPDICDKKRMRTSVWLPSRHTWLNCLQTD